MAAIVHIAEKYLAVPSEIVPSILAFVRFSLESVLRNGRRSLYAIIGIVIALSLISGSWIAVDSSGMGLMRAVIDEVPVDFIGSHRTYSMADYGDVVEESASVVSAIDSVEGVEAAATFITVTSSIYMNSSGAIYLDESGLNYSGSMVFLSNGSEHLLDYFNIDGDLPDPETVAIPEDVADSLDVGIGDEITCQFVRVRYYTVPDKTGGEITYSVAKYVNVTSVVSSIWTQKGFENPNRYPFGNPIVNKGESEIWLRLCANPLVFNLEDFIPLGFDSQESELPYSISWDYFIWTNRGETIKPANVPVSIEQLDYIQNQLAKRMFSFRVTIADSELVSPLESYNNELQGRKPLFLALSLPILALGVYLSMVGVDLGVTQHTREAAILKSRGASNRQVFESLIVEAIVLGAFSGFAGLLLGVLVSRFMLSAGTTFEEGAFTGVTDFLISPATVVLCLFAGMALMLLSSYGPFKRVSAAEVRDSLHEYSPVTTQLDYWAKTEYVLLSLCALSIVAVLLGYEWPSHQGFSWVVELLVTSLFVVGIVMFPVLPFMLSFSLVRLLTRSSTRLYSKFTMLVKPWTKDLHYLVNKNIIRNPRRASNLCLIISLALAFGLFISITMESTVNYEREQVQVEVGADVKLDAVPYGPVDRSATGASFLDGLDDLPGVEHAARYSQLDMHFEINWDTHKATSVAMNSTDYLETVDPSDFFFYDGGKELIEELDHNGSVLLTKAFADEYDLMAGDIVPVLVRYDMSSGNDVYFYSSRFDVVVAGLVKGLPGLAGISAFIDFQSLGHISSENLTGLMYRDGALIDVADGTDPHVVAEDAERYYEGANLTCTSVILQDRLDALEHDPSYASLVGFLYMEYVLSVAIMTIGVGLLIFVSVHDREKELASIMARGSSGGQVRKILMGESISLMALGLVVGAGVGILTAYLFNTLSGEDIYTVVERRLVFTYVSLSIVLSSIVALLVAALIATSRAGKIRLAEVLRVRGG